MKALKNIKARLAITRIVLIAIAGPGRVEAAGQLDSNSLERGRRSG